MAEIQHIVLVLQKRAVSVSAESEDKAIEYVRQMFESGDA